MAHKAYIVHVYSGFENKVKTSLEERIATSAHPDKFSEVVVPTEQVVELVKGKRKTSFSYGFSFSRSSPLTRCGLALPLVALITWPTKKPKTCSFPARYWST